MAYQDKTSHARRTAQQAMNRIIEADGLIGKEKLATAAGQYESAAGFLRQAAQATRDAIVERELEREDSEPVGLEADL